MTTQQHARTDQTSTEPSDYALGFAPDERNRLDLQAEYYRMATVDAMRWAGIGPGCSVLDLGSGTGAVAFDAADRLEERLRADVIGGPGSGVLAPLLVSAWARKPG